DPIANDRQGSLPIDAASVRFIDPENGNEVVFLEIQGEGTWEIDPFTGGVTFSPETGFTGETTPIGYLLYDGIGAASNPALLIVAVMATPRAENDNSFPETVPGAYAGNVLDNDSMAGNPIDPDAVTISFSDPGNTGITIDESGEIYVPVGTEPGVHTLSYTLCDVNFPELCDTATVTLTIGSVDLTVHNVISPNGDGVNDHLVIKGIEAY